MYALHHMGQVYLSPCSFHSTRGFLCFMILKISLTRRLNHASSRVIKRNSLRPKARRNNCVANLPSASPFVIKS